MKQPQYMRMALIISMAGLMAAGCGSKAEANSDEAEKVEPAIPVEAHAIVRGDIANYFAGPMTLETETDAMVVAKASGIVEKIYVEEGQRVKAGQKLAQLEDAQETHQLAQAKALLRQYESDFKRNKELFGKNLISAEIYERSQYAYEGQNAAWKLARMKKGYTTLRAPFAGVVAERSIKVGNMVALNDPTFRIIDYAALKATLYVPEIELDKLQVGQPATVKLDALPGRDFKGEVRLIAPVVDPASGTVKVTVAIDNSAGALKPGMFGRIEIMHEIHRNVLLLPKEAVLAEDKETNVFVVADTLALRRKVTLGLINSVSYEIIDGLQQGEQVITTGQSGLRDSTRIFVVEN
ncbi:MAG: efflux RND transporter periplasmic adaptor subunit [Candidatus Marinimicrobia bacterium]|nr:efflux RND transporter periplasmic adaptor subunit [Candidatus Neomarinimicrobiota bacterium]